jgi:hypothetical protein
MHEERDNALDGDKISSVRFEFWPSQNTSRGGNVGRLFSAVDYTRIATISGWMPMMFIILVRL